MAGHPSCSAKTRNALRLKPDHPIGAGHQLLNVLKGEMSLVGPRPIVRDELAHYGSTARYYLATRPGLTGLWQVSGRSDTTYAERVRMDRHYVVQWTLLSDLRIIARTVPALLTSKGAR